MRLEIFSYKLYLIIYIKMPCKLEWAVQMQVDVMFQCILGSTAFELGSVFVVVCPEMMLRRLSIERYIMYWRGTSGA